MKNYIRELKRGQIYLLIDWRQSPSQISSNSPYTSDHKSAFVAEIMLYLDKRSQIDDLIHRTYDKP